MGGQGRNIPVPRPPLQSLGNQMSHGIYRAAPSLNHLLHQTPDSQKLTHSSTGGFGSSNTSNPLFGQNKPAFGSTNTSSAPSLFGNNSTTTGFGASSGGFGNNTSTGFGAANNTGSAFNFGSQANKPAFGPNAGSSLFGQGGAGTTGGFGSANSAFGSASGTALNQVVPPSEGTGVTPFQPTNEKETNGGHISYQSLTFQQPYKNYSFEVCKPNSLHH